VWDSSSPKWSVTSTITSPRCPTPSR
jgi:hypothetical protein